MPKYFTALCCGSASTSQAIGHLACSLASAGVTRGTGTSCCALSHRPSALRRLKRPFFVRP